MDPVVAFAENTQAINRYSYVYNKYKGFVISAHSKGSLNLTNAVLLEGLGPETIKGVKVYSSPVNASKLDSVESMLGSGSVERIMPRLDVINIVNSMNPLHIAGGVFSVFTGGIKNHVLNAPWHKRHSKFRESNPY